MSGEEFRGLVELYPSAVRRNGMTYPVTVQPWPTSAVEPPSVVRLTTSPPLPEDPQVRDDVYLRTRLDADRQLHDGATLCWLSDGPNRLDVTPGGYFDMIATCGALRAEAARSSDWTDRGQNPLRAAVHDLVGDPLRSGGARSAAVGVSVILTVPRAGRSERALVIGQRPGTPGRGGGKWHVAPSGMLEWDGAGAHLRTTVLRELHEELGVELSQASVQDRLTVLGIAQDLTMLRPDLVVRLDLRAEEVPDPLRPASEFDRLALVPLTSTGFAEFWQSHPPSWLLPHAAGAIAMVEATCG